MKNPEYVVFKCSDCKTEITKDAKVCPVCEKEIDWKEVTKVDVEDKDEQVSNAYIQKDLTYIG